MRRTALLLLVTCAACGGDDGGPATTETYVLDRAETKLALSKWQMDDALLDRQLSAWNGRLLLRSDKTFVLDFASRDKRRERTSGGWSRAGDAITLIVTSRDARKLTTPQTTSATVDGDLLRLHSYEKDQYELVLRKQ